MSVAGEEEAGGLELGGPGGLAGKKRTRTPQGMIEMKLSNKEERRRVFESMSSDPRIRQWLDTSASATASFLECERVTCKICKKTKQYVKISDVRSHEDGSIHKEKAKALVEEKMRVAKRMAALGVEIVRKTDLAPHEVAVRARSLAHCQLVALGCNPTLLQRIFDSGALDMLDFAKKYSLGVGARVIVRDDLLQCEDMVKLRIKNMLKGRDDLFYALIIDGAGSKLMLGHHVNAILISCPNFPKPILLKLDVSPNGSGKAEVIAAAIMKVATEYGLDLDKNCVGLMADNAAVSGKVATLLGFQRQLRCLAQTVAQLILAAIEAVPGVKTFLLALHAIFTAGGNMSRRNEVAKREYAKLGLNMRAIDAFSLNRWGTASTLLRALTYRKGRMLGALRLFFEQAKSIAAFKEAIGKVKAQGSAAAAAAAVTEEVEEVDEEDEDEEENMAQADDAMYVEDIDVDDATAYLAATTTDDAAGVGLGDSSAGAFVDAEASPPSHLLAAASSASSAATASSGVAMVTAAAAQRRKADVGSAALRFVDIALNDDDMYAKLLLVTSLVDQLDFLVGMASRGDDSAFSSTLIKEVMSVGEGLRSAAGDPESNYFLAPVLAKLGSDYDAEKKAMLSGFAAVAVTNMAGQYRHVEDWTDTLRKKILWDHRVPDYKEKLVPGKQVKNANGEDVDDQRHTAGFFGMTKQLTLAFVGQWNTWVAEMRTGEELTSEPGEYWRSKAKSYPYLYKIGLWYAAIPLSAVSAQRAVGLMRVVETPERSRLKEPAWHAETFLRYNKWLNDDLFDEVRADISTLTTVNHSPQAAAAADVDDGGRAPF